MEEKFYHIVTFGCQMNVHESEKLAGMLHSLNYKETEDENKADVIIFNTCCIREGAEQKAYGNIGAVKKLKKNNKNLIVAVCGCMAQKEGTIAKIKESYPYVDIVFGTHNAHLLKEYILKKEKENKKTFEIWQDKTEVVEGVETYRTSGTNAWVNISYGCNNFCTYCIVPYVRGREISRKPEDIIYEVKMLISEGYKTITLLGQNVNSYGHDFKDENITFAKLLASIAELHGDFRLKFMTSHPKDLTSDVIETIAKYEKISKTIHLPVQSGSSEILKAMNRRYTAEKYKTLIDEIKEKIPNVSLTTDIIVGFPGETEEDFNQTCELVRYVRYNNIFAFMYSKRSGTRAATMENQVPIAEKRRRVNYLLSIQKDISKEIFSAYLNTKQEVLVKKINKNGKEIFEGTTDCGKTVELENYPFREDKFYTILITDVKNNKLKGKIAE